MINKIRYRRTDRTFHFFDGDLFKLICKIRLFFFQPELPPLILFSKGYRQ